MEKKHFQIIKINEKKPPNNKNKQKKTPPNNKNK